MRSPQQYVHCDKKNFITGFIRGAETVGNDNDFATVYRMANVLAGVGKLVVTIGFSYTIQLRMWKEHLSMVASLITSDEVPPFVDMARQGNMQIRSNFNTLKRSKSAVLGDLSTKLYHPASLAVYVQLLLLYP